MATKGYIYTIGPGRPILRGVVYNDHTTVTDKKFNFLFEGGFSIPDCEVRKRYKISKLEAGHPQYFEIFLEFVVGELQRRCKEFRFCDLTDENLAQELEIQHQKALSSQANQQMQNLSITS